MNFSTAEQARVRRYLGYPDLFRYRDTRLESAIIVAGDDPDASALVRADLTALESIDAQYLAAVEAWTNAVGRAGVKSVDEIEFFEGGSGGGNSVVNEGVLRIGRSLIGRISITLGVPIYGDYFGTRGYPGDSFMGGAGGGSLIPLG